MATPPADVRAGLTVVTAAAAAEVAAVASQASGAPLSLLLEAVPGIVDYYLDGAAVLAAEWYDELRDEAATSHVFVPAPITVDRGEAIRGQMRAIAVELERSMVDDLESIFAERAALVAAAEVAAGFRDTITGNAAADPDAVGWRRFARPGACKFCLMLAARGAVYTESTARFAAHGAVMAGGRKGGNCMCIAGPAFASEGALEASPMQYMASSRRRSEKQRADLRAFLTKNYPGAPG